MEHPHARLSHRREPRGQSDLLTWLRRLGDPAVDAALARRSAVS